MKKLLFLSAVIAGIVIYRKVKKALDFSDLDIDWDV